TRFRVQPAGGDYPQDRWYAWLNDRWVAMPPEVIVPEYAPDGRAYLFVINVSDEMDGERDIQVIACFVRPRGGLLARAYLRWWGWQRLRTLGGPSMIPRVLQTRKF